MDEKKTSRSNHPRKEFFPSIFFQRIFHFLIIFFQGLNPPSWWNCMGIAFQGKGKCPENLILNNYHHCLADQINCLSSSSSSCSWISFPAIQGIGFRMLADPISDRITISTTGFASPIQKAGCLIASSTGLKPKIGKISWNNILKCEMEYCMPLKFCRKSCLSWKNQFCHAGRFFCSNLHRQQYISLAWRLTTLQRSKH